MQNLPRTRKEAIACKSKMYAPTKPCKFGFLSPRLTTSCNCTCDKCRKQKSERIIESRRTNRKARDSARAAHKNWREKNVERENKRCEEWRKNNPEYSSTHYYKNRESKLEKNKAWNRDNRKRLAELMRERRATPSGKSELFIRNCIRRCINKRIMFSDKRGVDVIGYTPSDLIEYITPKLKDGMSWDNYGEWHIDHIKSIKAFIDEGVTDPAIINALDNLQPLWASENLSKGAKYNENQVNQTTV